MKRMHRGGREIDGRSESERARVREGERKAERPRDRVRERGREIKHTPKDASASHSRLKHKCYILLEG